MRNFPLSVLAPERADCDRRARRLDLRRMYLGRSCASRSNLSHSRVGARRKERNRPAPSDPLQSRMLAQGTFDVSAAAEPPFEEVDGVAHARASFDKRFRGASRGQR